MSLMLETYGKIYIYYYSLDSMVLKFMVLMYELTVLTAKVPPPCFCVTSSTIFTPSTLILLFVSQFCNPRARFCTRKFKQLLIS